MLFSGWGLIDSTIMNTRPRSCPGSSLSCVVLANRGSLNSLSDMATAPILPHDRAGVTAHSILSKHAVPARHSRERKRAPSGRS